MIAMMIYDRIQSEQEWVKRYSRSAVAYLSDDSLHCICVQAAKKAQEALETGETYDMACMDVGDEADISLLREFRRRQIPSELLLIADESISPMRYLTPDIRAASLLIRPFQKEQCRQVVTEFFRAFYSAREQTGQNVIRIENRDGRNVIPCRSIYYIEVRERKLFFRLRDKEYSQYGSLDALIKELPESFMRCHRSFVFNTEYLVSVKLSENLVCLENGIMLPLSRSYKADMKEYVNELRGI